ncbi:MAG: alkane 1-monooxygenase, partial [Candidatus Melainabacteria bacterium HGW-Melainabacteria-1]
TSSLVDWVGLLFLVGLINGGFSINLAHELSHSKRRLDNLLAALLWFRVGYMHFQIEHLQGHHPRMGTPADPATARLGESVYRFYLRCIPASLISAWRIEQERLSKQPGPAYVWQNQVFWCLAWPLIFCGALTWGWGAEAALFYGLQSLLAILTLETVNYIEHYGLQRMRLASGQYEKIGPQHAWNSSRRLSNYFLLNLQRHSDHHMQSQRPYQILRAMPEAPQLPAGYGWMVLLALVPPLWHRIMDPRAAAFRPQNQVPNRPSPEPAHEVLTSH